LAKSIKPFPQYNVSIDETHHTQKLDHPSGTAITLAEEIISNQQHKKNWVNEPSANMSELVINSYREENVVGTHIVHYESEVDSIEIKHTAHSREGFAVGAVMAAEWLIGKKGVFGMNDMLGFT
ncbi:MAG: 4-hydroxy-tetrahydrodipicolinate reductase, partial [Chitinophagaceae bacterium]